ncbi:MAG: hypothetical protein ACC707_00430 [Thiohalomonadales bacterium]
MRDINYTDGISQKEASSIANAYLYLHGRYKGRALMARVSADDTAWLGKVYALKSAASPINVDLPPVVVSKLSGEVSWQYGPTLKRIDLEELDNKERSRATY